MAGKFVSKKNIRFMLYDVLNIEQLTRYPLYRQHNKKAFDMIIDAAIRLAKDLLWPVLKEMDEKPPVLVDGNVRVHPSVREIMKQSGEGGWIASSFPEEHGGEQLPFIISFAATYIFGAANYSGSIYPGLNAGAAHLITSFGSREQNETYVEKLLSGQWQGTMALTEPQAGSSLTDIATTAYPTDQGYYRIQGHKIFISAADHDAVENVINLMLAKIEGAPAGIKGISLFIVPRQRIEADGSLTPNDITVTQVYHKMGYRGTPLTELSIGEHGDCRGYLVGEPHKGLKYMFQMMNEARLEVGLAAAGIATAAYYAALDYARERPQGRKITEKDPSLPQIPIIEHADVRRMLLFQRAVTEGGFALLMQCSLYSDLNVVSEGGEKEKYNLLLELLTPMAKSYPSEMGVLSVSSSMQCFGGYGFCDDFPVEQYYRDMRIHPIHEGTTGIQAMDLLGRKVVMQNGKAMTLLLEEIQQVMKEASGIEELKPYAGQLNEALETLQGVTLHLIGIAQSKGPEAYLADATVYLEMFSIIAVAWQWLKQAVAAGKALAKGVKEGDADFYQGKICAFKFFFHYELPKIMGLAKRLKDNVPLVLDMPPRFFND